MKPEEVQLKIYFRRGRINLGVIHPMNQTPGKQKGFPGKTPMAAVLYIAPGGGGMSAASNACASAGGVSLRISFCECSCSLPQLEQW